MLRQVGTTAVALVVLVLIGIGGLVFAELVPDGWVVDALEEAETRGEIDAEERPTDDAGAIVDQATECTTLSIGLGEAAGQSIINTTAIEFFICCFSQEFITYRNLIINSAVKSVNKWIIRIPILLVKIFNRLVIPTDYTFISW